MVINEGSTVGAKRWVYLRSLSENEESSREVLLEEFSKRNSLEIL